MNRVSNKHEGYGSRWVTVPNNFPEPDDLTNEDRYHLFEGYCVGDYETKPSGKHYKKVRTIYCDSIDNLLMYCGYDKWHEKYKIERNPIMRFFFGSWKLK